MKKQFILWLLTAMSVTAFAQQQATYRNPIIAGFHPDPSVLRVGNDYYIVNSSFEYFPGVPLYHSRDLVNWEQIGNVLDRDSQLPLKGASSWLGIYAPTLRYHNGIYYMITTNVGNGGNFLVTAKNPKGPWSEPVWLQQQGIDPSLLFEGDKCYMVSNPDNVITLCEIDPLTGRQLTPGKALWRGTGGRYPEGPHLYKIGDYYYLMISEGGTELAHRLTIARSKTIYGPYESNPANPIMTNCNMKGQSMQIQGTGHGDLVEDSTGQWWVVFLAYRNFGGSYHHLGRETCLAPVAWKDGWPIVNGGEAIDTVMTAKLLPQQPFAKPARRTTFASGNIGPEWVHIQNPIPENYQLRDGVLRLIPHTTLNENDQPTYLGRRQESPTILVETSVRLHAGQADATSAAAGLAVYQINDGYYRLYVTSHSIKVDTRLKSVSTDLSSLPLGNHTGDVCLRITSDGFMYHFLYSLDGHLYKELTQQNCALVSTEVVGGFTGVTLGMFMEGSAATDWADFSYFDLASTGK